ncbi:MAG: hypothetical protein HC916_18690 [Coleofasciculaceae cyanobacterium SM2_1_6]|nr:hypothetical protein [Coleofasciculaceae cyanobacterium SM2_1_6]
MEEIGKVDRIWLNPRTHRIIGFTAKTGLLGMKKRSFAWQQIYSLGNNILVNNITDEEEWQKPDSSEQILDWELLTEDGNKAGKIEDYLIEPTTGEVISYLFLAIDRGNILTRRFLLSPEGITNIGNKRVLARTIAVETSEPYTEGLNLLLTQARDFIIEDKENTVQHLEIVKEKFTNLVTQFKTETPPKIEQVKGQVTGRVQELREQATEKAQIIAGQATEKVQELREQATEKAQVIAGQATEKAQELREQAKQQAQHLVEEAQPLINQAKEKAQKLAGEAQPIINQAKEKVQGLAEEAKGKVQSIADEAKKQLDKNQSPELVAPGDENITQTIEIDAARVNENLPLAGTAIIETTPGENPGETKVEMLTIEPVIEPTTGSSIESSTDSSATTATSESSSSDT